MVLRLGERQRSQNGIEIALHTLFGLKIACPPLRELLSYSMTRVAVASKYGASYVRGRKVDDGTHYFKQSISGGGKYLG